MILQSYYICPVCGNSYDTEHEAIECKNSHDIRIKRICYCEACGQGWNVEYWGLDKAIKLAKECEQKHRKDGNFKELQAGLKLFFKTFK